MPSPHSRITTDPEVRAIIDALLVRGTSPHQIAEQVGGRLGLSRSSIYRYAKSFRSPLAPRWIDENTKLAEAVTDLGKARLDLRQRLDAGPSNADTARLTRELTNVLTTLKTRFDVDADSDEDETADTGGEEVHDGVYEAARRRPDWAREFADALRACGHVRAADNITRLAEHHENTNKEK